MNRPLLLQSLGLTAGIVAVGVCVAVRHFGLPPLVDLFGVLTSAACLGVLLHLWLSRALRHSRESCASRGVTRWGQMAALFLALVFAAAGSYKIARFGEYVSSAGGFAPRWAPHGGVLVAIATIPGIEMLLALFLAVPRWRWIGGRLAFLLLAFFTLLALGSYGGGHLVPSCGCNWPFLRVLAPQGLGAFLARNAAFLGACILVIRTSPPAGTRPTVPDLEPGRASRIALR